MILSPPSPCLPSPVTVQELFSVARDAGAVPHVSLDPVLTSFLSLDSSAALQHQFTALRQSLNPEQRAAFSLGLAARLGGRRVPWGGVGVVALALSLLFDQVAQQVRGPGPAGSNQSAENSQPEMIFGISSWSRIGWIISSYLHLVPAVAHDQEKMAESAELYDGLLTLELLDHFQRMTTKKRMSSEAMQQWLAGAALHLHLRIHQVRLYSVPLGSAESLRRSYRSGLSRLVQDYTAYLHRNIQETPACGPGPASTNTSLPEPAGGEKVTATEHKRRFPSSLSGGTGRGGPGAGGTAAAEGPKAAGGVGAAGGEGAGGSVGAGAAGRQKAAGGKGEAGGTGGGGAGGVGAAGGPGGRKDEGPGAAGGIGGAGGSGAVGDVGGAGGRGAERGTGDVGGVGGAGVRTGSSMETGGPGRGGTRGVGGAGGRRAEGPGTAGGIVGAGGAGAVGDIRQAGGAEAGVGDEVVGGGAEGARSARAAGGIVGAGGGGAEANGGAGGAGGPGGAGEPGGAGGGVRGGAGGELVGCVGLLVIEPQRKVSHSVQHPACQAPALQQTLVTRIISAQDLEQSRSFFHYPDRYLHSLLLQRDDLSLEPE